MPADLQAIKLRPEQPGDEPFLFELYASTRQEELDAFGWPPEVRAGFLKMQFQAQRHGYRTTFPAAEFQVVLLNEQNVGRLIVNRTHEEFRIVDVALLPAYRCAEIGTALIQTLFAEAAGKPVRLTVLKNYRASRLYQRLGFVKIGETELHDEMEWRADFTKA
jgi:ribosomal protein S18 acetylase RimI-like enzyme